MPGNLKQRPWREITEDGPGRRQLVDRSDRVLRDDLASERLEVRGKCIRQTLRATARKAPTTNVRRECERERDAAGRPFLEGKHAVRGDAPKYGASPHSTERAANETGGGLQRPEAT